MAVYKKEVDGQTVNYQQITTETVIANPSAEVSDKLEKLQVGEKVYSVGGGGNYVLELTGESGTLTDEQYQAVVNNFPNVTILQDGIMYDLVKTSLVETGIYRFVTQSIQNGNKIIELSYIINADKTWLFTTYEIAIPSSSGGLTWRKVTKSELQALMTLENIGKCVKVVCKVNSTGSIIRNRLSNSGIGVIGYNATGISISTSRYIGIKIPVLTTDYNNGLICAYIEINTSKTDITYYTFTFSLYSETQRITVNNTGYSNEGYINDDTYDFYIEE